MTPKPLARAVALLLALSPLTGRAADAPAKGAADALELACAVARGVGLGASCSELALFKHEGETRLGEELSALLDASARTKALGLLDAELAEKKAQPGAACSPSRPLCAFTPAALAALRSGLAGDASK